MQGNARMEGYRLQRERPRLHGHGRIRPGPWPLNALLRGSRINFISLLRVLRGRQEKGSGAMGAYVRTFALFAVLTIIFVFFGWAIGSLWFGATAGILVFLVLAGVMNAVSYFASDRIVLWSYRAKLVTEAEAPARSEEHTSELQSPDHL